MTEARVTFSGAPGSPYTRKMLAVLRYRRIPYRFLIGTQEQDLGLPQPKVHLLPTFYLPNDKGDLEAVTDSTPLIRRFENDYEERKVVPSDPVLAFLDFLLEDYGDEWLTKAMFHYRWYYDDDIKRAGDILPRWRGINEPEEKLQAMSKYIAERQISRLYVVGSNDITAPVIEASYERFLALMDAHLAAGHGYFLGGRPGSSDFAAYGQLTQLAKFDPTPMKLTLDKAPRVFAWTDLVDDLSGLAPEESDWFNRDAIPDTLKAIFKEIGRVYVPAMLANADALLSGAESVECEIDGKPWSQKPFNYQGRCLQWIRQERGDLSPEDRAAVDAILEGTGCEKLFE